MAAVSRRRRPQGHAERHGGRDALLAGSGLRRLPGGYGGQSGEKRPGQPGHHRSVAESSRVSGCGIPGSGHGLRVGRAGKVPARGVPYGLSAPLRPLPLQRPVPVRGALFLRPGRGRRVGLRGKVSGEPGAGREGRPDLHSLRQPRHDPPRKARGGGREEVGLCLPADHARRAVHLLRRRDWYALRGGADQRGGRL